MIPEKYTYLLVNGLSILIPFIASFDKRSPFYKKWRFFFPAMFITMAFFIAWDVLYTHMEIWGFNERYLTGINIINLPLEEWLFFFTIPYACVFTYEAFGYIFGRDNFRRVSRQISWSLIFILLTVSILYPGRLYTSVTFGLTAIFIYLHLRVFRSDYLGHFYFSYLFILFPFFIVNGILTGSFIEEQVVYYDDTMNLGVRMFTIPIEDSVYGLLLILMNVTLFEYFKRKAGYKEATRKNGVL